MHTIYNDNGLEEPDRILHDGGSLHNIKNGGRVLTSASHCNTQYHCLATSSETYP